MSSIILDAGRELSYFTTGPNPTVIFLHGIMGSKKNLQSFIKLFARETMLEAIAFDLRNHGESSKHWPPFTVAAAANDIVLATKALHITPRVIIGHSFGASVAMVAASSMKSIEQLWMLDCSPKVHHLKNSAQEIIELLEKIDWPVPSRKALVEVLEEQSVSKEIALWMTTNLRSDGEGMSLIFEPWEMKAMLLDFINVDGWPIIQDLSARMAIHIVMARYGGRLSQKDAKMLAHYAPRTGYFHILEDAGHFLHSDNPTGLLWLMKPFILPRRLMV